MASLRNYFFIAFTYYRDGKELYKNWYNGESIKDSDGDYWSIRSCTRNACVEGLSAAAHKISGDTHVQISL